MGPDSDAPQPGFDHWVSFRGQGSYLPIASGLNVDGRKVPQRGYITDELTDYAVDWLNARTSSKPFFLYLSHKAVHSDFIPAERHKGRYRDKPFVAPKTMADTAENSLGDTDELYDLQADPIEARNLIRDPARRDTVSRLNTQLFETLAGTSGMYIPLSPDRGNPNNLRRSGGCRRRQTFRRTSLRDDWLNARRETAPIAALGCNEARRCPRCRPSSAVGSVKGGYRSGPG